MKSFKSLAPYTRWMLGLVAGVFALSAAAAGVRAPWGIADAVPAQKIASPGSRMIQFDRSALDEWPLGESGEITLPSGATFAIRADRIEEHASGNRSWVGKLEAGGLPYSVVVTYGEAGVTGEFMTPDGVVQIRGRDGQVYLIDVAAAGQREAPVLGPDSIGRFIEPDPVSTPAEGPAPIGLKAIPAPQTTIDLLIVYTPGMVTRYNTVAGLVLRLNDLVAKSNQAYIDSEIAITVRLVTALPVAYTETNSNGTPLDEMSMAQGVFNSVSTTLRTRYGADIVALIRPFHQPEHQSCGIAFVGGYNGQGPNIGNVGQAANGFAVISDGKDINGSLFFCSDISFPHELGHVMGNMHDRSTATQGGTQPIGQPGAYSYSYGYTNAATFNPAGGQNQCNANNDVNCFGTVMSYITSGRLYRFSNSQLANCTGNGLPCGVASGDPASADTAQSMNSTRIGVASWRATKLPFKPNTHTGSGQTTPTMAPFALPLIVTVRDQVDAVVPGVTVVFSAPGAGPSAALSATTVTTDATGQAQVTATANGTNGSYTVVATANPDFVATTYSFSLTNGAVTPTLTVVRAGTGSGTVTGSGTSLINCPGTCVSPPMPIGTPVTLTATAAGGSMMTGWLGAPGCPSNTPCTVSVNNNMTITATFAPNATLVPANTFPSKIDPDLNGSSQALLDGLVVLRHLFGVSGAPLTASALAAGAARTDPAQITTYLNNMLPELDIDGDGRADASTDGLLFIRYLFSLRGPALISGAVSPGATRTTFAEIEAYIATIVN